MAKQVTPIPEGFHTVTPHIIAAEASKAIEFYQKAFGAEEVCRMEGPDGKLWHAEVSIGNSRLMIADEFPDMGCKGPNTLGGSPVTIHLYVADCDAAMKRATDAGAEVTMPAADMFWGDRYGKVKDPFGHNWSIATRKEILTEAELNKRAEEMAKQMANCGEHK